MSIDNTTIYYILLYVTGTSCVLCPGENMFTGTSSVLCSRLCTQTWDFMRMSGSCQQPGSNRPALLCMLCSCSVAALLSFGFLHLASFCSTKLCFAVSIQPCSKSGLATEAHGPQIIVIYTRKYLGCGHKEKVGRMRFRHF